MGAGKLAAMVGHCCEAYWTNIMKAHAALGKIEDDEFCTLPAVQEYGNGKIGPALYKHPKIYELSEKAFNRGEKTFIVEKEHPSKTYTIDISVPKEIWDNYVNGIFTKTICEAKNLNKLKEAGKMAEELGLKEGIDFGYINDKCLTDLTPENEDGTCTVGIWFKPLPDDIAHSISKKYKLYRD